LLHFVAATFVSRMPADRSKSKGVASGSVVDSKRMSVNANNEAAQQTASAAALAPPSGWLGQRTFLFSFTQLPLDLAADPDGDSLMTRDELGFNMDPIAPFGLVTNASFGSFEPLSSLGCSPFRRDVLVEVDYMADAQKSMRPREGFDGPAIEDFARHNIALHVMVDDSESIPRVQNLGGSSFSWGAHLSTQGSLFHAVSSRLLPLLPLLGYLWKQQRVRSVCVRAGQ
jgi:hypothetical protein